MNKLTSLLNNDTDLELILGIFLLTLAVSGNFIAETLSCKVRSLLSTNMYAKNMVILLIIYFSLGLVSDKSVIPIEHFKNSFVIWVLFLVFNKMSVLFTMFAFILLFVILVCKNWIDYYEATDKENNKEIIAQLNNTTRYLMLITCISIIIGFLLYFKKQYSDHYKNFNFITFLFGKVSCDSL
tara:strand:- start:1360 stop:1908 length:549 start_codon:yes stop_codon:yes gene_type:complete